MTVEVTGAVMPTGSFAAALGARGEDPRAAAPVVEAGATVARIIYELTERRTNRKYIGVTKRTLPVRIATHLNEARRDKPVRPGGLMAALRRMLSEGRTFFEAFDARIVDHATNDEEARRKERDWIETLGCRQPSGLNGMPGGRSLGGPANSRPVDVEVAPGDLVSYPSFLVALTARNRGLKVAGKPVIEMGAAYARLAAHWRPEEVLGYHDHDDGRSRRPVFRLNGKLYTSLQAAADDTGIGLDTLRSRLQRWRQAGLEGVPEIGTDRRQGGKGRAALATLRIPWPGSDERLTAAEFARRTGVAKATILHRWHRVREEDVRRGEQGLPPLTPVQIQRRLTASPTERRKLLVLRLPDGRTWRGGERELVRRVLGAPAVEARRAERLSESGIRRRLRSLSREERDDPARVRQAFGFALR